MTTDDLHIQEDLDLIDSLTLDLANMKSRAEKAEEEVEQNREWYANQIAIVNKRNAELLAQLQAMQKQLLIVSFR